MRLLMYLGDQLVDEITISLVGRSINARSLQGEIELLLRKHKAIVEASPHKPTFYVESIPSRVNKFVSLLGKGSNR